MLMYARTLAGDAIKPGTIESELRILIVEPDLAEAVTIGEMLDVQPDMAVVGLTTTAQEALQRAAELRPDVILMDIELPGADGIHTAGLLASRNPHASVVVVTAEKRPEYMQRAIVSGADGYLLKPIHDPLELCNTVRTVRLRALERRMPVSHASLVPMAPPTPLRQGRRFALFSPKGGQGKTSISVNLAVMLRQLSNQEVALVDADLRFGDANILLDLPTDRSIVDLLPHLDQLDRDLLHQVMTKHASGLHLLARPERAELAETISGENMEQLLTSLPQFFDYVVFDCEVSYDEKLLAVLDHADSILLTLTPNMGSLRNARHFLKLAEGLGYPRGKLSFVINRANSNVNLTPADVERALGPGHYFRLGSYGRLLTNDLNRGVPTVLSQPRSEFTRIIREIAEYLIHSPEAG
jgi:pilus assembly protein CpaE